MKPKHILATLIYLPVYVAVTLFTLFFVAVDGFFRWLEK